MKTYQITPNIKKLLLALILFLGVTALYRGISTQAQTTPNVSASHEVMAVNQNQVTVTVSITNATNVGAYNTVFTYNPQLVAFAGAVNGDFLTGGNIIVDEEAQGRVVIGAYTVGTGGSSTGTQPKSLYTMTFTRVGTTGKTDIHFLDANVTEASIKGTLTTANTVDGSITLQSGANASPPPTPLATPTPVSTPPPTPIATPSPMATKPPISCPSPPICVGGNLIVDQEPGLPCPTYVCMPYPSSSPFETQPPNPTVFSPPPREVPSQTPTDIEDQIRKRACTFIERIFGRCPTTDTSSRSDDRQKCGFLREFFGLCQTETEEVPIRERGTTPRQRR